MRALLVDAFAVPGEHRFVAFHEMLLSLCKTLQIKLTTCAIENLDGMIYDRDLGFADPLAIKQFDALDFIFVCGGGGLMPWSPRAKKLLLLMKMCFICDKCVLGTSVVAHMLGFICSSGGDRIRVLNGCGRGGPLKEITKYPKFGGLENMRKDDRFLDNRTGDLFRFNPADMRWVPYAKSGLRLPQIGEDVRKYAPRDAVHKCVDKPVSSKRTETNLSLMSMQLQHPLFKGLTGRDFVVASGSPVYLDSTANRTSVQKYEVLAEGSSGALIVEKGNQIGVQFDIDDNYRETPILLGNFITWKAEMMHHHEYLERQSGAVFLTMATVTTCDRDAQRGGFVDMEGAGGHGGFSGSILAGDGAAPFSEPQGGMAATASSPPKRPKVPKLVLGRHFTRGAPPPSPRRTPSGRGQPSSPQRLQPERPTAPPSPIQNPGGAPQSILKKTSGGGSARGRVLTVSTAASRTLTPTGAKPTGGGAVSFSPRRPTARPHVVIPLSSVPASIRSFPSMIESPRSTGEETKPPVRFELEEGEDSNPAEALWASTPASTARDSYVRMVRRQTVRLANEKDLSKLEQKAQVTAPAVRWQNHKRAPSIFPTESVVVDQALIKAASEGKITGSSLPFSAPGHVLLNGDGRTPEPAHPPKEWQLFKEGQCMLAGQGLSGDKQAHLEKLLASPRSAVSPRPTEIITMQAEQRKLGTDGKVHRYIRVRTAKGPYCGWKYHKQRERQRQQALKYPPPVQRGYTFSSVFGCS